MAQQSCGRGVIFGPVKPEGSGKMGFMRVRCKRYSCPRCGPRKLCQVRERIGQVATDLRLTRFISLTLDPKKLEGVQGMSMEDKTAASIPYLRRTWAKMRVLLSRKYGKSISFIAVLQPHESGIVHLHVLVGRFIPKEWLSEAWQSVGGGFVDIRYVDVHRVSAYLSGYLARITKLPGNTKRFSTSRGLALWEKRKTASGWTWSSGSIECQLARQLFEFGHVVDDERFENGTDGEQVLVWFVVVPG